MDVPALRTSARATDADSGTGMVLHLALFILLLAFFILLNALSSLKDDKVGVVLESVDKAFSRTAEMGGTAGDIDRPGLIAEAATAIRRIGDQVLAEIPLAKLETRETPDGDRFVLTVPETELFQGRDLRGDRTGLLHRVADVLAPRQVGIQVRLEALMSAGTGGDPAEAVARAGALARGLVHTGAPAGALTIGLEPGGTAGTVRLLFGIHDPETGAVRLSAEAGR